MTIDEKIARIGVKFRGLWRVNDLQKDDTFVVRWYVTFKYHNEYVECPAQLCIDDALDWVVNKLELFK